MKLQHLSVIFVIIILPIVIVVSVYTNNLIKVADTKAEYDKILMNSTYDAVRAYQLNTLSNSFASVNESRLRDVKASANTFFNSLASGLSQSGFTKTELNDYVPAILLTLYDGYYIYTPYQNIVSTSSSKAYFSTSKDSSSNLQFDFKLFTYYSCEYKSDSKDFDIIVNYTLDNYISVMGTHKGSYFTTSGYYINPTGISFPGGKTVVISKNGKNITLNPEELGEYISLVDQVYTNTDKTTQARTSHTEPKYYRYINYKEEKYYYDDSPNTNAISYQGVNIFYLQNNNRIYISPELKETLDNYVGSDVSNINNFKDVNYYYYYRNAVDFSNSVYDKLKDINVNTDVVTDTYNKEYNIYVENTKEDTSERETYHAKKSFTNDQAYVFDYNKSENDPETDESNFNNHRIDVIAATIEADLTNAIANFNKYYVSDYSFAMPALSEDDWNKIANNVTVVTFMQGMVIGNYQFYNNYSVVANTKNKEFISKNSIYVQDSGEKAYNGDNDYHSIGCVAYNASNPTSVTGYRNIDYELQKYISVNEDNLEINYYLQPQLADYDCVVTKNNSKFSADDYFEFNDKTIEYTDSSGKTYDVSINEEIRRAYIQALAREKMALSKNMEILNVH